MDARTRRAACALALTGTFALLALMLSGTAVAKDLSVEVSVPTALEHNAQFEVTYTVYNDASGATGAPVEIQLYLDNDTYGPVINIGAMPSNTQQTLFANITAPCGSRQLVVAIDINDSVAESNETNNNATAYFAVQPIVNFTYALTGNVGEQTLTLTAATQGCSPLNYAWNVDNVTQTGSPVDYTPLAGEVSVTLTASSPSDLAINRSYTGTVTIPNDRPQLNATLGAVNITTGQAVALQVQAYDADGIVATYTFDMGDGNTLDNVGDAFDYRYAHPGNYTITVTVTDNLGANATVSLSVTVVNRPPVADTPSFLAGEVGQSIQFDSSESVDPDGGNLTVHWDFGDGSSSSAKVATHAYEAAGTYTATLTVTDTEGGTDSTTVTVQVTGGDGGSGGLLVIGGILLFIAALALGYFFLMRERVPDEEKEEGPGAPGDEDGQEK